jgi:ABC-2 type transport system ATP-binding protein
MSSDLVVELERVDKLFHTRHILQKDEDTGKRRLYRKKDIHAVDDVSFGVKRGEVFGLLGPNGAGKTTTVKMVSGLVLPDSGTVTVAGLSVEKQRLKMLRKLGVVLEGTRTCIWPLTPLENLAYFGNLRNVRGKVLKDRARELLDFIGLKDKMNTQVRRLSRGQKQKLAICIALITDPEVLLLDEPTTGLDVQSSRAIKDKILEMAREHGKCALVTTHDMGVAQELCDRIGIIDKGRLVACKSTEELLDVFSDQAYEFRIDRLPSMGAFDTFPGVVSAEPTNDGGEPGFVVYVVPEPEERSRALYGIMDHLKSEGCLILSMNQRQQTLENVFLKLTQTPD